MKEINQTTFDACVDCIKKIINDGDYYQQFYDDVLKKTRCIKGGNFNYEEAAVKIGKDPKYITNLMVLYVDWANDYSVFLDSLKTMISIFHKDEEGTNKIKEYKDSLAVSKAAFSNTADSQVAGMMKSFVPERDTIDQAMATGAVNNDDQPQRITFNENLGAPQNYGTFATPVVPGLNVLPDGRIVATDPNQLATYLANHSMPMSQVAPNPNMESMVMQQQGMKYNPQFVTVQDGQMVAIPSQPAYAPFEINPEYIGNNNDKPKRPWCKYILDSGSLNGLYEEMKDNHLELFKAVKHMANKLLCAKKFIDEVYKLTHMDTALFTFTNVINENNFVISMNTCDNNILDATFKDENVGFAFR